MAVGDAANRPGRASNVANMPKSGVHTAGEIPRIPRGMGTVEGSWTGDQMVQVRMRADRQWPPRRASSGRTLALVCAAFAVSAVVASWVADPTETTLISANAAPSRSLAPPSFDERFLPPPSAESQARHFSTAALDRAGTVADLRVLQAREQLARQMQSQDWRAAVSDEPAPPSTIVPLPRARPTEPRLEVADRRAVQSNTAQGDQRTMLQKLSDLLPGRISLASLTSGDGLFRTGPDLAALGYDSFTAVYDISAQTLYLPNGARLEAHSGLGNRMDKVESVGERMVGATPPGTYELKPREKLFHGVRALRLIPADSESTLGRSGLLVHNYLLGPEGASNGCVSVRNYERFLKAYNDGEVTRLVVLPNLTDSLTASRRSPAPS